MVGRPNVGKSTLLNTLLRQTISATSPKPQTTQTNQLAILTLSHAQLIFVDTPGIHTPQDRLGRAMDAAPDLHLRDADTTLVVFDLSQPLTPDDLRVASRVKSVGTEKPSILVLNKSDAVPDGELEERAARIRGLLSESGDALVMSALDSNDCKRLLELIIPTLPAGPRYYPIDQVTDRYEREIAADLIRAAAMARLHDEVPHSLAVRLDQFKEREDSPDYLKATLFVERDSQKGIVIGSGGEMVRSIGIAARIEIEAMTGREVYLELRVKTLPAWRNDRKALARLGLVPDGKK